MKYNQVLNVKFFHNFSYYIIVMHKIILIGQCLSMLLFESFALAGYLVLEKIECNRTDNCIKPVSEFDPNRSLLYQILLDNSWPTSLINNRYDKKLSEKKNLEQALSQNTDLFGKYEFLWVPSLLEDLYCAATILRNANDNLSVDEYGQIILRDYWVNNSDLSDTNYNFQKILYGNGFDTVSNYFNELNKKGESAFFKCNNALTKFLSKYVNEKSEFNHFDKQVIKSEIENIFENKIDIRQLTKKIAKIYNDQVLVPVNENSDAVTIARSNLIDVGSKELKSDPSLLEIIVQLEIEKAKQDEALIFRGTNGVATLEGTILALDSTTSKMGFSLSFGNSPYSGLFKESSRSSESEIATGACVMNFIRDSKYGYALWIKKNDHSIMELFDIPNLGLIGRLLSSGEFFHPRSRVGLPQYYTFESEVAGVRGGISSYQKLLPLKSIVNDKKSTEKLGKLISHYIANHAIVISENGYQINPIKAREVIAAQNTLTNRKGFQDTTEYLDKIIELLKSYDDYQTLNAAEREAEIFTNKDIINKLVQLLSSTYKNIRYYSLHALELISPNNSEIHAAVFKNLNDNDSEIKKRSMKVLLASKNLDPSYYVKITEKLNDITLNNYVMEFLNRMQLPMDLKIYQVLLGFMKDEKPSIRRSAARIFINKNDYSFLKNVPEQDRIILITYINACGTAIRLNKVPALDYKTSNAITNIIESLEGNS